MKFVREAHSAITVRKIEDQRLLIGDESIEDSIMLHRERIIRNIRLDDDGYPQSEHVDTLIEAKPELIVIGCGWSHKPMPRELMFKLARHGIGLEWMDTPAACRTFNILLSEQRDVAAILVLDK